MGRWRMMARSMRPQQMGRPWQLILLGAPQPTTAAKSPPGLLKGSPRQQPPTSQKVHEAKENQSVSSGAAQSGRSTATTGDREIVGTAAAAGILGASGSTPAEEEPVGMSKEGVETSSTGLDEAEATAAEAAAAAAAAAGADGDQVKVSKKDEEEGINERTERDEAMEEELEAAAIREILGLRSAQDRKVQVAATRAVEALPPTQRECFEDVKAFAFGGAIEGKEGAGLSEEEVEALNTVAICGDRDGVVLAFLRHSKFDVRKAKESMRRCCAWRKENEADDLFKRAVSPAKMKKYRTHWPTGFHKQDRAGRPVFYDRVGQSDLSKLREDPDGLDQDEMVQIFTQNMEILKMPENQQYAVLAEMRPLIGELSRLTALDPALAAGQKVVLDMATALDHCEHIIQPDTGAMWLHEELLSPSEEGEQTDREQIVKQLTTLFKLVHPKGLPGLAPGGSEASASSRRQRVQLLMQVRRRFVLTRLSREAGRPVDQMTTVLDLTGLGMKHMRQAKEAMAYTRRISDIFQDNYSGMTCSLLILNAPWVFSKGWQVVESFLSEDTVAKVKVLGKGEAGLQQLEEYIPKENIPEFLGGESRAVIGPSDPLWSDFDRAVRLWGDDGDPFLDPSEVKRVSRRIAGERTSSASKSKSKSKSKSRSTSRSAVAAPGAKGAQEQAVPASVTATTGAVERGNRRGAADGGRKVRVTSSRGAAAASVSRVGKTTRSSSSKRSKRQLDSGKTVKGESEGGLGHADGEPAVDGEKHEDRRKRKSHRRQRDGLVSSEGTTGAGRPSLSSHRRASSSSVSRGAASDEAGSPSRKTRGSKRTTPQEDDSEEGTDTEDIIRDDGKAVALGDTVIGERALQGVAKALGPVLGAYFLQIVAGLASVGRVLWGTVESVLLLLRDLFFEQIEVEE
ncbi:conserved unknown protein [Ectocarpus siliculosus]|uniref:CRAL-TRIO domain-containing protein n=1 Tax=Ectocarpus siliculosus TaxID=2880 RepID=D7FPB8_ECTSI|nr:conserved unknown protein [Ectocarpus siliculosus]|eukprot:CBJ30377.1 conserved unknown protein [Ectocarpus siliculosus]